MNYWPLRKPVNAQVMLRFFILIALLLPAKAFSATLDDIRLLLSRSGIDAAVRQLDLAYDLNLQRQSAEYKLNNEQLNRVAGVVSSYHGSDLVLELEQALLNEFQQQAIQPIKTALQNEVVVKFRRFERIGNSTGQRQKLEDYLADNVIEPQRRELLRACHVADYGPVVAAVIQSFAEVDTAVALDRISGDRFTAFDYEGIKLWRGELEKLYAEQYINGADPYLAYTYRFVRDEQLQQYAEIWQDRNVQWFMNTALLHLRVLLQAKRQRMISLMEAQVQK